MCPKFIHAGWVGVANPLICIEMGFQPISCVHEASPLLKSCTSHESKDRWTTGSGPMVYL